MEYKKPTGYTVLPASVRYASIPDGAKILFSEIYALCSNESGICSAKNDYFEFLFNISDRTIENYLTKLKKLGVLEVIYKEKYNKRYLKISENVNEELKNRGGGHTKKFSDDSKKFSDGTKKNSDGGYSQLD